MRPPLLQTSDHWSAASSSPSGCASEKTEPNCWRKTRSLESRAKRAPKRLRRIRWPRIGLRAFEHHAAVEEQDPGDVHLQLPLEVARHQLVGDRGAHVVGDEEDRPALAVAAHQLLGQVRLPEEAVVVRGRLLGEAEAEEVEGEHVAPGQLLQQQPPVVGAGGEAVQEDQQRSLAPLAEDVDRVAAELLGLASLLPAAHPLGQRHLSPPPRRAAGRPGPRRPRGPGGRWRSRRRGRPPPVRRR